MAHVARWKLLLVGLAVVLSLILALPNALPSGALKNLPGWVPKRQLNLGLDLQGGSYLLLEVDTAALRRERVANLVEEVRSTLREADVPFTGLSAAGVGVNVRITDPGQVETAARALQNLAQPLQSGGGNNLTLDRSGGQQLRLALSEAGLAAESTQAVQQSIEIIRRRVDALGTKEPYIARQGANRIVVQAPGESDPARLKNVIGQTAVLTFQMVDDSASPEEAAAGRVPPGSVLLPGADPSVPPEIVRRRVLVSGENLVDARPSFDPTTQQPVVSFRFDGTGARRFASATSGSNVGKRFAIVLDQKIISAPTIQEPITSGSGQISGSFTTETAADLALLLRAGALPAPLNVEEERTVGAELGQDAIDAGRISTMLAFLCVLAFMVLAYGFLFGGIAVIALVVNGLMVVAAMSLTGAALTLPGIAGLILTLAVAVDANVLIYERMREEVRNGRTPISAMDAGFSRAMVTILDANITTLVAALILFQFGSGPVRGFAWTLSIGVLTSVFTAVLITQILL
ncbi:MAG: protein translocase subunit SecD, partial [Pseudomonadota bacterium]|nr:protein translocase subunit SecD [Pseudomonadota bacterium]